MLIFSQTSQKFLTFNPGRRISAFDALSHPYFQSLDSTSKSLYTQPFPSKKPSLEERAAWKTFLFYRLTGTSTPFLNLSSIAALHAAFRPRWSITTNLVEAFSIQQVISMSLPETIYKEKKNIRSCFPACLSSLAGSPSAQRKLHCQISDTEAATPCCQGSLQTS